MHALLVRATEATGNNVKAKLFGIRQKLINFEIEAHLINQNRQT